MSVSLEKKPNVVEFFRRRKARRDAMTNSRHDDGVLVVTVLNDYTSVLHIDGEWRMPPLVEVLQSWVPAVHPRRAS